MANDGIMSVAVQPLISPLAQSSPQAMHQSQSVAAASSDEGYLGAAISAHTENNIDASGFNHHLAERLPEMVNQWNELPLTQHRLHFSLAEFSGKTVIEITDQATGDVIRQIPSEEAVAFAEHWAKTQQLLSPLTV